MSSIRIVLSLAACYDLEVEQMDMKTAFLQGDLEEELYMEKLEGFIAQGKKDYMCKLKKSLYGLKQAPRKWYKKFESVIEEQAKLLGLEKFHTNDNGVDMLTKALQRVKFEACCLTSGMEAFPT
ncbi:cysteine-rich RLK (RECEPTOR-like protein kinase) 8 [Hibiscus trionum]|uniref:Cysteine-rich RLK (RECEPTOR-like protein kinase) 8 n=1 Tax=Hibiscus trionum TaxID=183268 RepID=A0A9W7IU66_HIBTR|nr:cysteine-rich RLK (RECEPTOR-like protein kinase) 8 [Hibiscus trionum]